MKGVDYLAIKGQLIIDGYGHEIDWQTNIQPVSDSHTLRDEAIWVILNSGMKEQIARIISNRIKQAWSDGKPTSSAFGHKGKVAAIDYVRENCGKIYEQYYRASNKIEFLQTIPFIGGITKYHLAKNLGHDCVKPDRHLVRIAKEYKFNDCFDLCKWLSSETGDKVSVVDIVLWRAANLGWL